MKNRTASRVILSLLVVFLSATTLYPQQDGAARIPDELVKERLAFIETALHAAQPKAKAWWYTWMSLFASATAVQGSLALHHWNDWKHDHHPLYTRKVRNRGFAESMLVGGVTAALGTGGLLVFPFKPAYLPGRLGKLPAATPPERIEKLAIAEDILQQCAKTEQEGWAWYKHLLNIAVNAGAGLVTVFAFNKPWTDGLITFAQGEAVSLVNIFTQPRQAIRDLARYNARYRGGRGAGHESDEPEVFVSLCPGGLSAGIRF